MKLERIDGKLLLCIAPQTTITFQESWVEQLRPLPYDQFGEYLRTNIYPALSDHEKKLWFQSNISNIDLQTAINELK
jgi:hypothetical protein